MDNLWIIPAFILLSIFISLLCFIYELNVTSEIANSEEKYIINKLRQSLNKMNSEQKIIALTIIERLRKEKMLELSDTMQEYIVLFVDSL